MLAYPNLLIAIRASGYPQYEIARRARLREGRLSEIIRRGGARTAERKALSRALSVDVAKLFSNEGQGD